MLPHLLFALLLVSVALPNVAGEMTTMQINMRRPHHFQKSPITGENELVLIEMKEPERLAKGTKIHTKQKIRLDNGLTTSIGYKIGEYIAHGAFGNVYKLSGMQISGQWISKDTSTVIKQMETTDDSTIEDKLADAYADAPPIVRRHLALMDKSFIGTSSYGNRYKFCTGPNAGGSDLGKFCPFFFLYRLSRSTQSILAFSYRYQDWASFVSQLFHPLSVSLKYPYISFPALSLLDAYVEKKFAAYRSFPATPAEWTMWVAEVELVAEDMADGLHNLHTLQGKDYPGGPFVHQDVKAANVFLTLHADGTIKKASIGDFGLVESFAQIQSHRLFKGTGVCPYGAYTIGIAGTPPYISPEGHHGSFCKGALQATDMWAMGLTLLEMMLAPVSRYFHCIILICFTLLKFFHLFIFTTLLITFYFVYIFFVFLFSGTCALTSFCAKMCVIQTG